VTIQIAKFPNNKTDPYQHLKDKKEYYHRQDATDNIGIMLKDKSHGSVYF
jgi:hypothetical protein